MKKVFLIMVFIAFLFSFGRTEICYAENKQEIYSIEAHLYDKNVLNKVSIYGLQTQDSPYIENIEIRVYEHEKILYSISPNTNSGYGPQIIAENFIGNGLEQIFYSASSGGSGGYGYYYVYNLNKEIYETLFDYEAFSKQHVYKGTFLDDYKAKIYGTGNSWVLDVSDMDDFFKKQIWDKTGKVVENNQIDVGQVNNVFPYYNGTLNQWDLQVFQKATAIAQVNTLGYVVNYLTYEGGHFVSYFITFNIT